MIRTTKINFSFFTTILLCLLFISNLPAQNNEKKIRVSPKAEVKQIVGLTDVTISYSRPGVKGRTIWGQLVPYDKVWRAGADEATKITFGNDVMIEGKKLKKGSYSFFTIPSKGEWTIIFNRVADQWGAFEYNEAEDALRVKVKPKNNGYQEWLAYTFSKTNDKSAVVTLEWEKMKIPFKIEVQ